MTIDSRIKTTSLVLVFFVLGMGVILFWNCRQIENGIEHMRMNSQIVEAAFMLRVLMDEQLTYPGKRTLHQWQRQHEVLGQILREATYSDVARPAALNKLRDDYEDVSLPFAQLVARQTPKSGEIDTQTGTALEETLKTMLSLHLEKMVNTACRLTVSSQVSALNMQKLTKQVIVWTTILMTSILLINLFLLKKSVVNPLKRISEGAQIVGDGNLSYSVDAESNDEVGHLASAFNKMTRNLKKTHDSLETEIRERKQTEQELLRSNADLEQFAYVASHDLQEPLRNVTNCVQILKEEYGNKLDADADQLIHYAVDSVVRMKGLINDLLLFSRVGTRGQPIEETNCEEVLQETLTSLESAITETRAVITHDPLPTVPADGTQLLQVFQNLVANAIKFRRDEPPRIHVSAVKNESEWVFSVKDNGIGIEPRHFERIFIIFQRLHKRTENEGSGMGLAIVKKIVERHKGRAWVESEIGVGSTFYFTIPDKGCERR
jgi:signal transduction histidine kinase